ncbi:MAG: orotidine 5'-phosphate decarboxylase [Nanoarchaeota archaeon]|nr:orotidine 5'-phosphate decarboxylase [Nanoarchaeota archaeon]
MAKIIKSDRSVIPACDVPTLDKLKELVLETYSVEGIGAYKIGFELVIPYGMRKVIETIRDITDTPIIYDHQKAATDIPDTGIKFMRACKGVKAVILFPQAGPETEQAWIKAAKEENMNIIVGGEMTHKAYLESDNGFLNNDMPTRVYTIAANLGVTDFVVPGNKPDKIKEYKALLEAMNIKPTFYSPGLIKQGGSLTAGAKAAGERWHAIIGRGIYQAEDMGKAAKEFVKKII